MCRGICKSQQKPFDIGRPSFIQPEVRSMSVTEKGLVDFTAKKTKRTHVTPFPNQEWLSSWVITFVEDLSPVIIAEGGYL